MIHAEKWKWLGLPGHFIGAAQCRFRMCTQIGQVLVSTVGDYRPFEDSEATEIGYQRKYETYVFDTDGVCAAEGCGCGMPRIKPAEIDSLPANDAAHARENHMALCRKWAELDGVAPPRESEES